MAKQEIEVSGFGESAGDLDEVDNKGPLGYMSSVERAKEIGRRKLKIAANSTPASRVFLDKALSKPKKQDESEELDELSKDTLKAYARKAVPDMQQSEQKAKDHINKSAAADDAGDTKSAEQHYKSARSANSRKEKRMAGIMGAIKRVKNESEELDEMDFGSIGKTLSKYGKGVPKDDPKKVSRSTVHTDYTMTGHKEKKSGTGRVYTKVLSDYDDDAGKAAKATQAPDQVEAPKRGRGRPAGALNKNGSGVTGKGWSAEAKASMKAKLAANKAAKLAAAKNESEELDESFAVVDHKGKQVHVSTSESGAKKKAEELSKSTGNTHTVKFDRTATVKESVEITEEDWADIAEGQSLDAIVEFMMDEEYQSLDELSKKTLGSYIKKSSSDAAALATNAMHLKNTANMHADASREAEKQGAQLTAVKRDQQASDYHGYQKDATDKQIKRLVGVRKATDRLTKESEELDESTEDLNIQRYAALIGKNLIKE